MWRNVAPKSVTQDRRGIPRSRFRGAGVALAIPGDAVQPVGFFTRWTISVPILGSGWCFLSPARRRPSQNAQVKRIPGAKVDTSVCPLRGSNKTYQPRAEKQMKHAASLKKARWISALRSWRTVSLLNWRIQANVRSTTHLCLPKRPAVSTFVNTNARLVVGRAFGGTHSSRFYSNFLYN